MRSSLAFLLVLLPAGVLLSADPPTKADAVRAKLAGFWGEYDARFPTEKQITSNGGIEWRLFEPLQAGDPPNRAYMVDHENESVGVIGELILNADADPMWLDFRYKEVAGEYVWVGIIRFEGDHLRWVRTGNVRAALWTEAKGKLAVRPTAFEDEQKRPVGYRLERYKPKGR